MTQRQNFFSTNSLNNKFLTPTNIARNPQPRTKMPVMMAYPDGQGMSIRPQTIQRTDVKMFAGTGEGEGLQERIVDKQKSESKKPFKVKDFTNEEGGFSGCDSNQQANEEVPYEDKDGIEIDDTYFDNEFSEKGVLYSNELGYWVEKNSVLQGRNFLVSEIEEMRQKLYNGVEKEFTEATDLNQARRRLLASDSMRSLDEGNSIAEPTTIT